MVKQDIGKQLTAVLEKIVFDKKELDRVKASLNSFMEGMTTPKALKQTILMSRAHIMEDLLDYFILYIKTIEEKAKNSSLPQSGNGVVEKLKKEIGAKNKLLEELARRVVDLELQFKEELQLSSLMEESQTIRFESKKIKELMALLYDSNGKVIKNEYRFIPSFITLITNWNKAQFGNSNGKTLPEIITEFQFPSILEDELVKVAIFRNQISHDIYELKEEDSITVYRAFFMCLYYLVLKSNPKSFLQDKDRFVSVFKSFISKNIDDRELKEFAFNTLNKNLSFLLDVKT